MKTINQPFLNYFKILIFFIPISVIAGQALISLSYFMTFFAFIIIIKTHGIKEFYKEYKFFIYLFIYLILSSFFINEISITNSLLLIKFFFILVFVIYCCLNLKINFFIKYSYYIIVIALLIFLDLGFQKIYKHDIFGFVSLGSNVDRLTGPFGTNEYIPASYIYHICLPSIFFLFINIFSNKKIISYLIFNLVFVLLVCGVFITGERVIFIMLITALILYLFFNRELFLYFFSGFILSLLFIYLISVYDPYYKNRYKNFIENIFGSNKEKISFLNSQWGAHYLTAVEIFKNNIFFGKGARSFRIECSNSIYESIDSKSKDIRCSTHPHNYYLEVLSETGFIGFVLFLIPIIKLIFKFIRLQIKKNIYKNDIYFKIAMAFTVPFLILLFPIKSSGSIFSNLYGLMFWVLFAFSYGFLHKCKKKRL
jgi:O-antigen ligase